MKERDRIWTLIAKKLAAEATEKELLELQELLKKYPDITYSLQTITDLWKPAEQKDRSAAEDAFAWHLQRLEQKRAESDDRPAKQRAEQATPVNQSKKTRPFHFFNINGMLKNYFKVSWRSLVRYKGFSLVNISGLAIGMASAILILLLIQNTLSFDRFHEKKDRIYMLYNRAVFEGKLECWPGMPMVLAPELKKNYPQVEEFARLNGIGPFILTVGERHFEALGNITDPGFLKIFSFPLLKGNIETALGSPRSMVVTEKFAKKLFGNADAMGKVVRIDSNANFTITGVMKDLPNNTTFGFEYLIPWTYMKEVGWHNPNWDYYSIPTVVLLKPGVSEKTANDRFHDILKSHGTNVKNEVFVHPISKWRLYSRFENGKIAGGDIENVRLFGIIAAFILFIACINYMNLSTARSVKRAREVGIRKVAGAARTSIILQFLGESILISFLSGIVGLIIVQLSLKGFNWLVSTELYIPYTNRVFWLSIIGFILITGIIAGSYPAFYLSAYRPIAVLKGTFKAAYNSINIRKVLVVLQFSFAITFIICTIIIYRQIDYGRKRDPGYNRDHLAFVYVKGDMNKKYQFIKNELLRSGAVNAVTRSNSPITYTWSGDDSYTWQGKNPNTKVNFAEFHTDNDFLKTTGLKIISGREIDASIYPTDSTAVLLNESAAKIIGFKDPIGQTLKSNQGNWHIVGVVKDFISGSPFDPVRPMILQGPKYWFGAITFRLNGRNSSASNLKKIEDIFSKYNPDYPFGYRFVDEADAEKIEGERRIGIQAALFGGLAILISCLGLFALAAYTAESRIKEIGVRKVLGASVATITALLSKDFLKLVIISFVIASPLAWWAMHSWLQNYPYRVSISWWIFALTGLLSMIIAVATVSYQSIKAALANPVKSLRSE
jgi:ABC-type antimicrobial peptide transport system permease subunit